MTIHAPSHRIEQNNHSAKGYRKQAESMQQLAMNFLKNLDPLSKDSSAVASKSAMEYFAMAREFSNKADELERQSAQRDALRHAMQYLDKKVSYNDLGRIGQFDTRLPIHFKYNISSDHMPSAAQVDAIVTVVDQYGDQKFTKRVADIKPGKQQFTWEGQLSDLRGQKLLGYKAREGEYRLIVSLEYIKPDGSREIKQDISDYEAIVTSAEDEALILEGNTKITADRIIRISENTQPQSAATRPSLPLNLLNKKISTKAGAANVTGVKWLGDQAVVVTDQGQQYRLNEITGVTEIQPQSIHALQAGQEYLGKNIYFLRRFSNDVRDKGKIVFTLDDTGKDKKYEQVLIRIYDKSGEIIDEIYEAARNMNIFTIPSLQELNEESQQQVLNSGAIDIASYIAGGIKNGALFKAGQNPSTLSDAQRQELVNSNSGINKLVWDGKDSQGNQRAIAEYRYQVLAITEDNNQFKLGKEKIESLNIIAGHRIQFLTDSGFIVDPDDITDMSI